MKKKKKDGNTYLCDSSAILSYRALQCSKEEVKYEKVIVDKKHCNNLKAVAVKTLYGSQFGSILRKTMRTAYENNARHCWLDGFLHILIAHHNQHHKSNFFSMHFYKNVKGKTDCIKLDKGLYALPPEVTFCMMAQRLEWAELLLLGLELCGTYSIHDDPERAFVSGVNPITTPEKIMKCAIELCKTDYAARGARKVLSLSNYLKAGSASPQESRLYVLLAGPHMQGCCGIEGLEFNQRIDLSLPAKKIAGQSFVVADIVSSKMKIAIEYDSEQFHSSKEQLMRDKRRSTALVFDQWKTVSVVPDFLSSVEKFHEFSKNILRIFNKKTKIRVKDFADKQKFTFLTLSHVLE